MSLKDNPSDRFKDFVRYVWEEDEIGLYEKDADGESTDSYGPGEIFVYNDEIGVDNSGGF